MSLLLIIIMVDMMIPGWSTLHSAQQTLLGGLRTLLRPRKKMSKEQLFFRDIHTRVNLYDASFYIYYVTSFRSLSSFLSLSIVSLTMHFSVSYLDFRLPSATSAVCLLAWNWDICERSKSFQVSVCICIKIQNHLEHCSESCDLLPLR